MRTHRLDVLSLVFGLLFVLIAIAALADAVFLSVTDLRWVLPTLFVALGLALVVSSMRRDTAPGTTDEAAIDAGAAADDVVDEPDAR
ncbi:MAG: hypothetical protein WD011_03450 [Nitriliruptoraceae bacterium]